MNVVTVGWHLLSMAFQSSRLDELKQQFNCLSYGPLVAKLRRRRMVVVWAAGSVTGKERGLEQGLSPWILETDCLSSDPSPGTY